MIGPRNRRAGIALVGVWALALGVNRSLVRVRGRSMEPTLHDGDVVLALPRLPRSTPRAGTIVEVDLPGGRGRGVKRVAEVTAAGIDVRGDRPDASTDSRHFGPVPPTSVRRRVLARIRPRPAPVRRRSW